MGSALCSTPATITTAGTIINTNVDTNTYSDFQSCLWTITAPEGFYPTITISSFATERGYDYFRVYDGPSVYSPLLFSQSGFAHVSETVTGSQSTMTVTFTSDSSIVDAGVVAVVGFSEQAGMGQVSLCSVPSSITTSGTIINTNVGVATYNNRQSCAWTITAPNGFVPVITFTMFMTEANYDYFSIYDGPTSSSPTLLHASGHGFPGGLSLAVHSPVYGTQSIAFVQFTSDGSVTFPGVTATVTFAPQGAVRPTPTTARRTVQDGVDTLAPESTERDETSRRTTSPWIEPREETTEVTTELPPSAVPGQVGGEGWDSTPVSTIERAESPPTMASSSVRSSSISLAAGSTTTLATPVTKSRPPSRGPTRKKYNVSHSTRKTKHRKGSTRAPGVSRPKYTKARHKYTRTSTQKKYRTTHHRKSRKAHTRTTRKMP